MFKKSIIWTNFTDGKTIYEMFKEYGISSSVNKHEKITYIRFTDDGTCAYRWTPLDNTEKCERAVYKEWIDDDYTELEMFNGDKEYAGII